MRIDFKDTSCSEADQIASTSSASTSSSPPAGTPGSNDGDINFESLNTVSEDMLQCGSRCLEAPEDLPPFPGDPTSRPAASFTLIPSYHCVR